MRAEISHRSVHVILILKGCSEGYKQTSRGCSGASLAFSAVQPGGMPGELHVLVRQGFRLKFDWLSEHRLERELDLTGVGGGSTYEAEARSRKDIRRQAQVHYIEQIEKFTPEL